MGAALESTLKIVLAGTMAACGSIESAAAADLLQQPAPAVEDPAVAKWAGFYGGIHAGYLWGKFSTDDPLIGPDSTPLDEMDKISIKGALGGLQGGYNWQKDSFVFGLEGDIALLDAGGSKGQSVGYSVIEGTAVDDFSWMAKVDGVATVRGRVGFALDNVLLYGTGGVAFAHFKEQSTDSTSGYQYSQPFAYSVTTRDSSVATGWTAGLGAEWLFTEHWSGGLQYLHADFGKRDFTFAGAGTESVSLTADTVSARLNYHW